MTAARPTRWRSALHFGLPALLLICAFFYRFNTLGGTLGGFDNDHFLHFVYAKQVESGKQPLRDFLDAGLQGARPSLTYEASALAQRVLGDNLRSEALLASSGIAVATMVTFLAARRLSPWPVALTMTVLSLLISSKLYGYPKVLTLAVVSLLVVVYPGSPRWSVLAGMAAWTAVAFLFRHDYALYCAVGVALVVIATHGRAATGVARVAVYGALTAVLIAPSLWWIERYAGIGPYVSNALRMAEREVSRTPLVLPVLTPAATLGGMASVENAIAWLYYVFVSLGVVALGAALAGWLRNRCAGQGPHGADAAMSPALVALGCMALVLAKYFLRGNLEGQLGDMVPVVAVLAAALAGQAVTGTGGVRRAALAGGVGAMTLVSAGSVWVLGSVRSELERSGLSVSPLAVVKQASRVSTELAGLPDAAWADPDARWSTAVARDLHRCTTDDEHVLVATYAPEVLAWAGRRFAGGRATVIPGFYTRPGDATFTIALLEAERVPFILAEDEAYYEEFPELRAFVGSRYVEVARVTIDGQRELRILAHMGLAHAADAGKAESPPAGGPVWCPGRTQIE